MRDNTTLLYLSDMEGDRAAARSRMDREIVNILSEHAPTPGRTPSARSGPARLNAGPVARTGGVRRAFSNTISAGGRSLAQYRSPSAQSQPAPAPTVRVTEQDVQAAVASLEETWTVEQERLAKYLRRNNCLVRGLSLEDTTAVSGAADEDRTPADGSPTRPPTAGTLATALRNATLDQTPTAELDRQLAAPALAYVAGASGGDEEAVVDGEGDEGLAIRARG